MADQSDIWSEIEAKSTRLGARSATGAAAAMYEHRRDGLDRMIASIKPVEHQVGGVFTIRGTLAGFDAFDSPTTWVQAMPKLLRSYGLDALDTAIGGDGFATPDPRRFMEAVSRATCTVYPAVGAGQDLRFEGGGIVGAALATDNGVVHAVAFPASDVIRPTVRRGRGLH
jgi:ARG and Rhodanese-Phosphatase-superfamily-associated Protein domain